MKLRQKLAVVLASAMIVTSVPVVTMAASNNRLKIDTTTVKKDSVLTTKANINIEFKDHSDANDEDEVFYLNLENCEFVHEELAKLYDANTIAKLAILDADKATLKTAETALTTAKATLAAATTDADKATAQAAVISAQATVDAAKLAVNTAETDYKAAVKVAEDNAEYELTTENSYVGSYKVKYEVQSKTVVKVTIPEEVVESTIDYVALSLGGIKVTGGDASVSIDTSRSKTTVSAQKFVLANTSDKIFKFSTGDKTTFYTDNDSKLSDLILDETYMQSLQNADDKQVIITLEIDDTDFNFYGYNSVTKKEDVFASGTTLLEADGKIEYKYGFANAGVVTKVAVDAKDQGKLYIGIDGSAVTSQDSNGQIVIKGLRVDCLVKDPDTGDFLVDISCDDLSNAADSVVMGEVSAFSAYIKMNDDKAKEIVGGRQEEIKFEIGEVVENSMVTGREVEVKFDENAHFDYKWLVDEYISDQGTTLAAFYKDVTGDVEDSFGDGEYKEMAAGLPKAWLTDKIIDNKGDWKVAAKTASDASLVKGEELYVEFDKDDDGKAIVDTLIVYVGKEDDGDLTQNNDAKDKLKFKLKACVPLTKKDNEKATLSISGRGIDNVEVSTTAITIKNPITLETEDVSLKVGLQDQVGGKIVITETDKEMFQQDGTITINVKDSPAGIKFQEDAKFEASEGIKKVKVSTNKEGTLITFTIKRDSKAAATITIPELHFTVDRTVPEGSYDIEIGGTALDKDGHKITVEDFIIIGTKNTGDLANSANGLAAGTATFKIGEDKYTLNDVEYSMEGAKSYIQEPGFTMVPVRYVGKAFGVSDQNILFANGVATIFAGNRTIQLTNGSDIALVNGAPIKMETAVVISEGRTYAPISEVAKILGISKAWDATTKTATFKN